MFRRIRQDLLPAIADPVTEIIVQPCEIVLRGPIVKNSFAKN